MRYLAAYLLSTLGGNKDPSLDDISGLLSSVGIEIDKEKANKVIAELKGKDVTQLIAAGKSSILSLAINSSLIWFFVILFQVLKN